MDYINEMEHLKLVGNVIINDKEYVDVVEVSDLEYSSRNISKIHFNKNNGIIKIFEKTSNVIWIIQE
jgi:hypothetical protein